MPCRPLLDEALLDEAPLGVDDLAAPDPVVAAEVRWLVAIECADPGRLAATLPTAARLARPATAVTARTLARLRSLAAIRFALSVECGWPGSGIDVPSSQT